MLIVLHRFETSLCWFCDSDKFCTSFKQVEPGAAAEDQGTGVAVDEDAQRRLRAGVAALVINR